MIFKQKRTIRAHVGPYGSIWIIWAHMGPGQAHKLRETILKIHIFLEIQVFVGSNVTGVQIDFTYSHIYRFLSIIWQIFENREKFLRSNSHIHIFLEFFKCDEICEYVKLSQKNFLARASRSLDNYMLFSLILLST